MFMLYLNLSATAAHLPLPAVTSVLCAKRQLLKLPLPACLKAYFIWRLEDCKLLIDIVFP